ncbi:MAG: S8 family serine peptidase [Salinirussus sp.]
MDSTLNRRRLLQFLGIGALSTVPAGTAAADQPDRHNVGTWTARAARDAQAAANSVHRVLEFGGGRKTVSGRFSDEALEALERRPDVRYVEPDGRYQAIGETLPWGIDRVDAELVHDDGQTGGDDTDGEGGADVAIIDTGIDDDHPDLQANVGDGVAYTDCSGTECNYDWSDDHGHGTHCAGIAGAVNNTEGTIGVAPGVTLHAVKVLASDGYGYYSDIAAGVQWVADQGYDVGSLSLGGSSDSSTLQDACQYATSNGVMLVAAAGNEGPCSDCVLYPARYDSVVAVSATESDDDLASFSSTGPEIELAAPGRYIYSTVPDGGYERWSGTSMACPHVSGAAGQLMDNGYTNEEARTRLSETAEDIGLGSTEQGAGLVDVEAAVPTESDTAVVVSTSGVTDVTATDATFEGTLDDLGGASSATVFFEYRQTGSSSWSSTSGTKLSSTGSFSDSVSGLDAGTEYEVRAIAEASDGDTDTGSTIGFTTNSAETALTVSTTGSSGVGQTSATLDGSLDDLGGASSVDVYFDYRVSGTSTWTGTTTTTLSSTGAFSHTVDGLSSGTEYEFRAGADASDGDSDTGSTKTFTTNSDVSVAVSTGSATNIGENSATLSGSLDDLGGANSADVGFEYRQSGTSSWSTTATETLSSTGSYSRTVDALSSGTEYEFRAVASASDGDHDTGAIASFSTDTSAGTAPDIDTWNATTADSPNPHAEITVDWEVSDADGDLATVTSELDSGHTTSSSIGGTSASGRHDYKIKHGGGQSYTVTLTVSDESGLSTSDSKTVQSDGGSRGNGN